MRHPRFEAYQGIRSEWRWRLRARNGRIIADSADSYRTRRACDNAMRRLLVAAMAIVAYWEEYQP